jgi:hypothetical protein
MSRAGWYARADARATAPRAVADRDCTLAARPGSGPRSALIGSRPRTASRGVCALTLTLSDTRPGRARARYRLARRHFAQSVEVVPIRIALRGDLHSARPFRSALVAHGPDQHDGEAEGSGQHDDQPGQRWLHGHTEHGTRCGHGQKADWSRQSRHSALSSARQSPPVDRSCSEGRIGPIVGCVGSAQHDSAVAAGRYWSGIIGRLSSDRARVRVLASPAVTQTLLSAFEIPRVTSLYTGPLAPAGAPASDRSRRLGGRRTHETTAAPGTTDRRDPPVLAATTLKREHRPRPTPGRMPRRRRSECGGVQGRLVQVWSENRDAGSARFGSGAATS